MTLSNQYSRYSQHARRSLMYGHSLARDCSHAEVDTDHLFVGILRAEGSVGHQVLADLQVERAEAEEVVRLLHPADTLEAERLPFSAPLREALIFAVAESKWLGQHYIGTEHILLGLVRSGRGEVGALWRELELSPDQIRGRVKRLVQDGISEINIEAARRMAKLSELGRRVLNAAEQVAQAHQQHSVGAAHLLFVLTQERRGIAHWLLPECHFDVAQLAAVIPTLPRQSIEAEALLDHLIDRAVDRAEALGSHYTGTEHILLAMTLEPRAKQLLTDFDADIDCLQSHLRKILLR